MNILLKKSTCSGRGMNYQLRFIEDCNHKGKIIGLIEYVYHDGTSSIMTFGKSPDVRLSWHRLCRINRAARAGRNHINIINNSARDMRRHARHGLVEIHFA